jgi:hypothetical protein
MSSEAARCNLKLLFVTEFSGYTDGGGQMGMSRVSQTGTRSARWISDDGNRLEK